MKLTKMFLLVFVISALLYSCSNNEGEKVKAEAPREVKKNNKTTTYVVDVKNSKIDWYGSQSQGGHHGTINIKDGRLDVKGGKIAGGMFRIDMRSIKDLDLTNPDENSKLVDQLKSSDFFETHKYPEAKFEITDIKDIQNQPGDTLTNTITGNLTMKDSVKSITFGVKITHENNVIDAVTPKFVIDRTQWGIMWGSDKLVDKIKNMIVSDDIGLKITLKTYRINDPNLK